MKIFKGDEGERVKTPIRFTGDEHIVNLVDVAIEHSLDISQAQSGFTLSPSSPLKILVKDNI